MPYTAPNSLTLQKAADLSQRTGGTLDLSNRQIRETLRGIVENLPYNAAIPGEITAVKETDDILVYYSKNGEENTWYAAVTPRTLYWGQIWINDDPDPQPYIEQWLSRFDGIRQESGAKREAQEFVRPTYSEGKRVQAGTLTVAVPDQLISLEEAPDAEDFSFPDEAYREEMKDEFLFLAVSHDHPGGFGSLADAMLGINIQETEPGNAKQFADLWNENGEVQRKGMLTGMFTEAMEGIGLEDVQTHYLEIADRIDAVFSMTNESDSGDDPWCSYFAFILHSDTIYQVNFIFNAMKDKKAFEEAVTEWLQTVRPAGKEVAEDYLNRSHLEALGAYAGENGKIDAVEVSRLFSQDVLFFSDGDLKFDGKHNIANGFQLNAEVQEDYQHIVRHASVFYREIMDLLTYVERNEKLMIPKEKIHGKMLPMTRNRPATGITFMDLCAWHLLLFAVKDKAAHEYICMVEPNLINGIPDGYGYLTEFLHTLLEFNGYTGDFSLSAALTVSADLLTHRITDPVPGASKAESFKVISVKGKQ